MVYLGVDQRSFGSAFRRRVYTRGIRNVAQAKMVRFLRVEFYHEIHICNLETLHPTMHVRLLAIRAST